MAGPAYLDECINRHLAERLRRRGFVVTSALEAGMLGATDDEHFRFAARQGLVILTHDRRCFQRLHRAAQGQGGGHPGIIVLPVCPLDRLEVRAALMLDWHGLQLQHGSTLQIWNDVQT